MANVILGREATKNLVLGRKPPFCSKKEMLHFVQHDLKGRASLHRDGARFIAGAIMRIIIGVSRSPLCGTSRPSNCEEPARATPVLSEVPGFIGGEAEGSQSPRKKGGDCFAPLAMTSRGGTSSLRDSTGFQGWNSYEQHYKDFSIVISLLARSDSWWRRAFAVLVRLRSVQK